MIQHVKYVKRGDSVIDIEYDPVRRYFRLRDIEDDYIISDGLKTYELALLTSNQYWFSDGCWTCD